MTREGYENQRQTGIDDGSDVESSRALLDQLFIDSRLYTQSQDYKDLLDFVVRLPNFAPFNAMLLQVQKPGMHFAASAHDWQTLFERQPIAGARPLLILWPFGPVALVYDELDTIGKELPRDVRSFYARGPIDRQRNETFLFLMESHCVHSRTIDAGDLRAGSIRLLGRPENPKHYSHYEMSINRNHSTAIQFVTIAHELAHLFLGHLGRDTKLHIPNRSGLPYCQAELEAESVAYLVCERNGVKSVSESYLVNFVKSNTTISDLDVYQVMRATGQIETMLNLARRAKVHNTQPKLAAGRLA